MIVHLFNSSLISGPERLVLPALASRSDDFLIVNLREERIDRLRQSDPLEDYSRSLNLRYKSVSVKSRWDRQAIGDLQRLLNELAPELVHAHDIKASVYLLQARRREGKTNFPIVSTHHGVHVMPDIKTGFYEFLYRRYFLKFFDRILCVSKADYEDVLKSGTDKAKVRLHLNGMNARRVDPDQRPLEAQRVRALWLPQDAERDRLFLFGVVARLSPEKDHDRLLQALSDLNHLPTGRAWKCLIFGMGALETKLKQQTRDLGLEQRILWMGYRKEVGNELGGLDMLLSFSKAEGLPINLLEAGWAGTPVMCTPVGGIPELITDDAYGSRIPLDEPPAASSRRLQAFLLTEGQAPLRMLGRRLQERVMSEFSQDKWLQRLRDIYSELNVKANVLCN